MFLYRIQVNASSLKTILFTVLLLFSVSCFANIMHKENIENNVIPMQIENEFTAYQYILMHSGKKFLWLDSTGLTSFGLTLNRLLADIGWFDTDVINNLNGGDYPQYDRLLTDGFLTLIKINDADLNLVAAKVILADAIDSNSTRQLLRSIIPQPKLLIPLRKAITRYRELAHASWPVLKLNFIPKQGRRYAQVKTIRKMLILLGDLPVNVLPEYDIDVFDQEVITALKKFQYRHGLAVDGKLGPNTYNALQVSPKQRVKQLQVNLWRWFTLPRIPKGRYLIINIPGYQLSIIENGKSVLQMKVIVGKPKNQTPQMVTTLNRFTLNPGWTPPLNIIKKELIPKYQRDYLSLQRNNFQLIKGVGNEIKRKEINVPDLNIMELLQSYKLVQAPGGNNALGIYRFNIPNNFYIYIHDTPTKYLFNHSMRALSHGCIRLENANLLANYLLRFTNYSDQREMNSALKSGETHNLYLTQPLPVYITYQTAWIDKQGELRWSADIYGLDNKNIIAAQL